MLLFDMDGTLINSNGIWHDVDVKFLENHGLPYTQEYYEGVAHTALPLAAVFTKEYGKLEESCEEIIAEWMDLAGDLYHTVPIKAGVREYLDKCRAKGERMAVLTSCVPSHCRDALESHGLNEYFEEIFFAQEMGLDKRKSEIYRKVAAQLGVTPEECTIYDDSTAACRAAREAGMEVVGVYDDFFHGEWEELQAICHRTIRSFEELL